MFDTNEFLRENRNKRLFGMITFPYEDDEFCVSIQAGRFYHCTPKENDVDFYETVELGFPNEIPPDYILEYADDPDCPKGTVYAYVPVEKVNRWLNERNFWPDIIE